MPPPIPKLSGDATWGWLLPPDLQEPADSGAPRELLDKQDLEQQDIVDTFLSPQGQRVLQRWWKFITMTPGFDATLGYERGVALGFAREGQRALLATVIAAIERHEERARKPGGA